MTRKTKYTNEPLGSLQVVPDFLPPPEELVLKEERVKVTMALSQASVDFFKREAARHHTSYQAMIRRLLDLYAAQHTGRSRRR